MAATPEHESAPLSAHDVDDHRLLTVHETALFLNVSITWVYEHVRPGSEHRLPVVKLGKYLRFDRRDLRAYLDAKRSESLRDSRR
jgi:excisionase family DNA binding protein